MKHSNLDRTSRHAVFNGTESLYIFCRINVFSLVVGDPRCLTCGTEEEGLGLSQVLVHCISDGHLSVGEGAVGLFISCTHLSLDVIEQ